MFGIGSGGQTVLAGRLAAGTAHQKDHTRGRYTVVGCLGRGMFQEGGVEGEQRQKGPWSEPNSPAGRAVHGRAGLD